MGQPLLLHICCGPCAAWPVPHLRDEGWELVGWWHNPNIQPATEHALRQESAAILAAHARLPVVWGPYEPERFEAAVHGRWSRPERCRTCYRLRLEAAAEEAARRGIETFSTTLLISPYQDQAAIRAIGDEVAAARGLRFHFENLRRGWVERGKQARALRL